MQTTTYIKLPQTYYYYYYTTDNKHNDKHNNEHTNKHDNNNNIIIVITLIILTMKERAGAEAALEQAGRSMDLGALEAALIAM